MIADLGLRRVCGAFEHPRVDCRPVNTFPQRQRRLPAGTGRYRAVAASVLGLLILLIAAGSALAHSDLVSSDPADKAVLATPPTTITLTFSEDLDPGKSSFKLVGPAGTVGDGTVSADPVTMTLEGLALDPGDYEIQWTSAALDGDILRGTLTFTISEAAPTPETPSAAPSVAVEPSVAPSSEPTGATVTPAATPAPSEPADTSGDVVLPIVIALVLVAGVGAYVLRRSRRA